MSNEPYPKNTTQLMQNAAVALGNGVSLDVSKSVTAVFQVSGTFSGTVAFECSLDGTNWSALTVYTLGGSSGVTTATAAYIGRANVAGLMLVRARVSVYASGSITVNGSATSFGYPFAATNQ